MIFFGHVASETGKQIWELMMLDTSLLFLNSTQLMDFATEHNLEYIQAKPFPHIVVDNFFPKEVLDKILSDFPKPRDIHWQTFENTKERKLANASELQMSDSARLLLYQLNSSLFINFLEKLTGISGIIPDPHFSGGGYHQIERGGFLKLHIDFNKHPQLNLDRRLNLLLYLNKEWEEDFGGHLQLWEKDLSSCGKKILPIFNRLVIFNTTDFSYHGHPDPLTCPEGMTRKSLALYYYSNGRPEEEITGSHSTVFQARPGETFSLPPSFRNSVKRFIPPIIYDLRNKFQKQE